MKTLTAPTIHLNGSSSETLLKQIEEAYEATGLALEKLAAMNPHGRDYYPQGDDAYTKANHEHVLRLSAVQMVVDELRGLRGAVLDQIDVRAKHRGEPMITKERAEEIRKAIWKARGWGQAGREYTNEEEREISRFWLTLPGNTSFYDAVALMGRGEHLKSDEGDEHGKAEAGS